MNAPGTVDRLLVGLAIAALLAGCGPGASPTPAPSSSASTSLPSEAVLEPSPAATAATAPTPGAVATYDIAYESTNPVFAPGVLDVYAPARAGPWPVVVMFNGLGGERGLLSEQARRVADLGFAVFSADWGGGLPDTAPGYDQPPGDAASQAACAVAFARAHAAEYGGDPATMIVFGHAAGANLAALVAFARPEPTAGCLGGATLGEIDALITWDGDWVLALPSWDDILAADPRVLDVTTPWTYLADHRDLKVVMLAETRPEADIDVDRPLPDPEAVTSFFATRDPSGVLRKQLEANGALADDKLDSIEEQQLLLSVLEAQGNPVSLDVMPGSSGANLSAEGWKVFLAAFTKAAAKD
jgi:alpha-beta hydrolase superfamily lysophospholipase